MNKKITAPRIFVGVLLLFVVALISVMLILPSFGYFKVVFDRMGVNTSRVELIFDRLDFESSNVIGATITLEDGSTTTYDASTEWGSVRNPYVINQKHHVQNLSVLQNNGFFKERVDENGDPEQSFFLVCNNDGTPVAIDCEGISIAPIGTHENPFTGNISGAFVTGSATYNSYGVSVSTIGNVTVSASESEPDIGFFGMVGYFGTASTDSTDATPIIDGYGANISNLLFADVTIEAKDTVVDVLADWWNNLTDHTNLQNEQQETHHVGIIAGHAEFATLSDLNVFYSSESIKTFALSGSAATNFYSITGLVGTLQHVNPKATEGSLIGGAGNSVSDGDMLIEGGFGGGGAISGTLTGYMLAETIFNEHEMYLQSQSISTKDQYDVKEMKKRDGSALFNTVTMQERIDARDDWKNVDYYTFQDTVFTFAMSSSSKDTSAVDYVQKIWKNPENVTLSATQNSSDWVYTTDPNPNNVRIAYKFTAIEDANQHTAGGYYVLSYQDKNGTDDDWTDDTLYLMKINNTDTVPSAACYAIPVSDFVTDEGELGGTPELFAGTTDVSSFRLVSTNALFHEYTYTFKQATVDGTTYNRPFTSPFSSIATSLGLTASRTNQYSAYSQPEVVMSDVEETIEGGNVAYLYDWSIRESSEANGKFAVYTQYSLYGWRIFYAYYTKGTFTFDFNAETQKIEYRREQATQEESSAAPTVVLTEASAADDGEGDFIFNIYKVEVNTTDADGNPVMNGDNLNLTAKNFFPQNDPIYNFDPSKYVLESDGNGGYTVAPIRSYNLNSGRGTYLTQLNHIVKLFKPTTGNFQISWSENSLIGSWFGDAFNTNSGGVIGTEIGTTGEYATIPAGMVSFYISEASPDDPSYINIIVAVNPGQTTNGRIGLWEQAQDNGNQVSFSLTSPDQYFDLPISKVAANDTEDRNHILTISNYKSPQLDAEGNPVLDEKGNPVYTDSNSTSYVYLGGEIALVYHSFAVTTPGIYFMGSGNGSMSVAYFSVSGAAGTGADGSSASPLGNVDFVYANNGQIITIDKKFTGIQDPTNEDHTLYYPSYYFVTMIPKNEASGTVTKIQSETIYVHRYVDPNDNAATGRRIKIIGCTNAKPDGTAEMYQDTLETS